MVDSINQKSKVISNGAYSIEPSNPNKFRTEYANFKKKWTE